MNLISPKEILRRYFTIIWMTAAAASFTSCGNSGTEEKSGDKTATAKTEVPKLVINEAEWVDTDLSKVAPFAKVTMKLPKGVDIQLSGGGGLDINLSPWYQLHVSVNSMAIKACKEQMQEALKDENYKGLMNEEHKTLKYLVEEPNGAIYQYTSDTSGPTTLMYYYVPQGEYAENLQFEVRKPMDKAHHVPGEAYTEELARKVYQIVKTTVKPNK